MRRTRRSSTSSSSRLRPGPAPLVAFAGALLLAFVAGQTLGRACALPPDNVFAEEYALPADGTWELAYDDFHLDHWRLWHGMGASMENARRAQLLLVGTSRVQFAATREQWREFTAATGLRTFALGMGYGERSPMVLGLIERFDLRPEIVVANATSFFSDTPTDFAATVMAASAWDAWKTVFEREAGSLVRHGLLGWIPHRSFRALRSAAVVYRSPEDGAWFVRRQTQRPTPVDERPEPGRFVRIAPEELRAAVRFRDALAARGAKLVLAYVPTREHNAIQRDAARELARLLGVPLVAPVVEGLGTRDGDHLSDESQARFGRAFIGALEALPEIRDARGS